MAKGNLLAQNISTAAQDQHLLTQYILLAKMLGKRKRQAIVPISKEEESSSGSSSGSEIDAQEIFRRHFEAQFEALPEVNKPAAAADQKEEESGSEEEEEAWDGISDDGEAAGIQIVEHTTSGPSRTGISREELKAFMVQESFDQDLKQNN
jgi:hypothetical protein